MRGPPLQWIRPEDPPEAFPDPGRALRDPDGLLAVGGDLTPVRLLYAYRHGIFPWYGPEQPILWWSPDPRAVLQPRRFHRSRSLQRRLRRGGFEIRFDSAFLEVVDACAAPRRGSDGGGTWITPVMRAAYGELYRLGHAHCIEVWMDGTLTGGLYGVALGKVFFGESMFSRVTDASKIALNYLTQHLDDWGYRLLDCQVHSQHLASLGSETMARDDFLALLARLCDAPVIPHAWQEYRLS